MRPLLLCLLIALPLPAHADSVREAFTRLRGCVAAHRLLDCKNDVTAGSQPLYTRFNGYGLGKCLPASAHYLSEQPMGVHRLVRASAQVNGQDQALRLAFTREKGRWKLDIPESLHVWLGENWEQLVNAAEQIYLLLRQQLGDALDCQSAKALIK